MRQLQTADLKIHSETQLLMHQPAHGERSRHEYLRGTFGDETGVVARKGEDFDSTAIVRGIGGQMPEFSLAESGKIGWRIGTLTSGPTGIGSFSYTNRVL